MDGLSEMTYAVTSVQRLAMMNPYGDAECVSVDLGKHVNVTQLAYEISALAGVSVMITQITAKGLGTKLYVFPVVDEEVITRAVKDHEIDDLYGMDAVQRKRHELMKKLSSGDELSSEEMRDALMAALSG